MACSIVGAKILQKEVGRALLGRRLAFPDPLDVVRFAHVIQLLACPGEMWATHRSFLLLYREGAGGSHEGSSVQALGLCGDAPGVCADWFSP